MYRPHKDTMTLPFFSSPLLPFPQIPRKPLVCVTAGWPHPLCQRRSTKKRWRRTLTAMTWLWPRRAPQCSRSTMPFCDYFPRSDGERLPSVLTGIPPCSFGSRGMENLCCCVLHVLHVLHSIHTQDSKTESSRF